MATNKEQTRRNRLNWLTKLIVDRHNNSKAAFAVKMQWPATDVSRYFTRGKHGRSITDDKAREIERRHELPKFCMDEPPGAHPTERQDRVESAIQDARDDRIKRVDEIAGRLPPYVLDDLLNFANYLAWREKKTTARKGRLASEEKKLETERT